MFRIRKSGAFIGLLRLFLPEKDQVAIHKFDSPNRNWRPFRLLVALGAIAFGVWSGHDLVMLERTGARAQGTVVRIETTHKRGEDRNRYFYYSVVQFETADGRKATVKSRVGSARPIDTKGDIVAVIYNPIDLEHAIIDRGSWNWALPGVCVLIGGLAFVRLLLIRSQKNKLRFRQCPIGGIPSS